MVKASMLLSVNRADVLKGVTFKFSSWNKVGKLEPSTNNEVARGLVSRSAGIGPLHTP